MKFETPEAKIPEKNELPLRIQGSSVIAKAGESDVFKILAQNKNKQNELIALKQVRKETFANENEMTASKKFYEDLKSSELGKFVPDTLYFKAKMTSEDNPQAYRLQRLIEGKPIDQMKDENLYADPVLIQQLLEFANAAIQILQTAKEENKSGPDFIRTPEFKNSDMRTILGGLLADPRYSSNIIIADGPNEDGQRVFFVDTAINADERTKKSMKFFVHHVVSPLYEFHLKRWIRKLELKKLELTKLVETNKKSVNQT